MLKILKITYFKLFKHAQFYYFLNFLILFNFQCAIFYLKLGHISIGHVFP